MRPERRIAREIYPPVRPLDHIAAPKRPVKIENCPAGRVNGRYGMNGESRQRPGLPPIQFVNWPDALGAKQPGVTGRNDEGRIAVGGQPSQTRQVQVVVMIVAEKHGVNTRQIFPGYARVSPSPRTCPRDWTGSVRPHRVGQNSAAAMLKQHRRMVHQGGSECAAFQLSRRSARVDIHNERGRRLRPAGQFPPEDIEQSGSAPPIWIVETLSVEVLLESRTPDVLLDRIQMLSPIDEPVEQRTRTQTQASEAGWEATQIPSSESERQPNPTVDYSTIERRPGIHRPPSIGFTAGQKQRVPTRLAHVRQVLQI